MLTLIAAAFILAMALGYRAWGGLVARQYSLDASRPTPAVRHSDGVDFVPTRPFYLLGQHFSAIAAAGPIAGPILACQQFGWLPALLWISLGVVFIGAVHDFSTLVASIRHEGRSIAEVLRAHLGRTAGVTMLTFIWVCLLYVIVAFTDVTASTFVAGDPELAGLDFDFNPGGAVAAATVVYLGLAVVMGLLQRFVRPPLWVTTAVFVPATLAAVWLGTALSSVFVLEVRTYSLLILGYCVVASLTPVWLLLQPRGYLGGFVLYLALAVGLIGLLLGDFEVEQPAFKGFHAGGPYGSLFPFLFVTIACGACSGFHGLVCSGTTSKQLANERHSQPVGFGAMLLEGFVALIALSTVMMVPTGALGGAAPGTIYGVGLGRFAAVVLGPEHLPILTTFGAMAFSTFVFDTLDVSTRLGRMVMQELLGLRGRLGAVVGTALTIGVPLLFVLLAKEGSWRSFWTLFGTSNQLLAALSLLAVSVWLRRTGRRYWYTLVPMLLVSLVTLSSLGLQVHAGLSAASSTVARLNGSIALVLLSLALVVMGIGFRALRGPPREAET